MELVGGIPSPLKNMKVNWDHYSQYKKIKMFQTTNQSLYFHGKKQDDQRFNVEIGETVDLLSGST